MSYQAKLLSLHRSAAAVVATELEDAFERGHIRGWRELRVAAESITGDADAEITRLQAQVAELQALSVTHILLDVVPGDGSGQEVYAKSVFDVVNKLSELADLADSLQAQVDALAGALVRAQKWIESEMLDKGWPEERVKQPPEGSHLHAIAAALAAAGR